MSKRRWYYDVLAASIGAFGTGSLALNWLEWWAALIVALSVGGALGFQLREDNDKS